MAEQLNGGLNEIIDAAYTAAYASNEVFDVWKQAEPELERMTRMSQLYHRAEGEEVFTHEISLLESKVNAAKTMFELLGDNAGIVMSPNSVFASELSVTETS